MKELAQIREDARPQPGPDDAKFEGIARLPLARRWLRRKLKAEMRAAVAAGEGAERERHKATVEEIRAQLRPEATR